MAEEFEHRDVCYRLFRTLYAQGLWGRFWNGWLYRVYGFARAVSHLGAYSKAVRTYLIKTDQAKMTPKNGPNRSATSTRYPRLSGATCCQRC